MLAAHATWVINHNGMTKRGTNTRKLLGEETKGDDFVRTMQQAKAKAAGEDGETIAIGEHAVTAQELLDSVNPQLWELEPTEVAE